MPDETNRSGKDFKSFMQHALRKPCIERTAAGMYFYLPAVVFVQISMIIQHKFHTNIS